jgi:hypothetical protein
MLQIEVEAGGTYYVDLFFTPLAKMKLVDAATGAKEMRGLHPAKD